MIRKSKMLKIIFFILCLPINLIAVIFSIVHIINIRASSRAVKINNKLGTLEKGKYKL